MTTQRNQKKVAVWEKSCAGLSLPASKARYHSVLIESLTNAVKHTHGAHKQIETAILWTTYHSSSKPLKTKKKQEEKFYYTLKLFQMLPFLTITHMP